MCFIYIVNAVVNAVLFGVFVEQFQIIRRKKNKYQDKIDISNKVLYELEIPKHLREEIRTYFKKINETKCELSGQKRFFNDVSPSLKQEVKAIIFKDVLLESKSFVTLKLLFRRDFRKM